MDYDKIVEAARDKAETYMQSREKLQQLFVEAHKLQSEMNKLHVQTIREYQAVIKMLEVESQRCSNAYDMFGADKLNGYNNLVRLEMERFVSISDNNITGLRKR
jgi:predicted nuclease with TOPRIM domain